MCIDRTFTRDLVLKADVTGFFEFEFGSLDVVREVGLKKSQITYRIDAHPGFRQPFVLRALQLRKERLKESTSVRKDSTCRPVGPVS